MKYLKLFEEIGINKEEFPTHGHELSVREKKILTDLVGSFSNNFKIIVEDHYYYINDLFYHNKFDTFNDLKDYVLSRYYFFYKNPEKYLELLKTSNLDPSFDDNRSIKWATKNGYVDIVQQLLNIPNVDPGVENNSPIELAMNNGHKEIVILLLNDERVISKLSKKQIDTYKRFIRSSKLKKILNYFRK